VDFGRDRRAYQVTQEMINPVTKDTLYLILPIKVNQLAMLYAQRFGGSVVDAIRQIYSSNTYKQLEKEETKLWHFGQVALFEYYLENR
jgi:hypothetical protein